jgi:glycosyltransferase involved in cell wall biosynthesis
VPENSFVDDGPPRRTILIANPSADVYGSDLQMLESISAMVDTGWRVIVVMPTTGELSKRIRSRGAEIELVDFPVLRRSNASLRGVIRLAADGLRSVLLLRRTITRLGADAVYVNTVTLPWWILAGRLARVGVLVHVHEAELEDKRMVRVALNSPLLLAHRLVLISESTRTATTSAVPGLARKSRLVYNGVNGPDHAPEISHIDPSRPVRLAIVARLSPRKAADVALEAVGILRRGGRDVEIEVCGTPFAGYEWFEQQLRSRAEEEDLRGAVTFSGYVSPIWPALERAHIVVAPSLREPFGNAVVEAQLCARPVVASSALGHTESILHGVSGLLVTPGDAQALADAVARLIDDRELAIGVATRGRDLAIQRFSTERYNREITETVQFTFRRRHRSRRRNVVRQSTVSPAK